jgi:hypothetical protein
MKRPEWETNESQWISRCCQIRARAEDLVEGRIGAIEAARVLLPLIFWTRGQDDPDLAVFTRIDDESADRGTGAFLLGGSRIGARGCQDSSD